MYKIAIAGAGAMGGRIGTEFASTRITIVPDKDDGKT